MKKLLILSILLLSLVGCTKKSYKQSTYVSSDTLKYVRTSKEVITVIPPRSVNLSVKIKCDSLGNVVNELDYTDNNSSISIKDNTLIFKYNQDSILMVNKLLSDSLYASRNQSLVEKEKEVITKYKVPEFMWYVLVFFILLSVPTIGMILRKFSII